MTTKHLRMRDHDISKSPIRSFLKEPALVRESAYSNGVWIKSQDQQTFNVNNPADGAYLGQIPNLGQAETEAAILAAQEAFSGWAAQLPQDRAKILRRWADLMLAHREDLALIMTLEQGKPLAEARGEIDYAASFLEWFGEEAKRAYGDVIPSHLKGCKALVSRQPVGVCALFTPWNFPSAMITRKAGAALAAGCSVVIKPSEETPFSALALAVLAEQAGVPGGVLNILTGDPKTLSTTLMESEIVRQVSFTGSTEVGRLLLEQSARTVKKVAMELGGHAPFIIFEDADLERAVSGAIGAKFATTGQDCLAINRLFIHQSIYGAFCEKCVAAAKALRLGNGLEDGMDLGPLMNEKAVHKCQEHIRDAVQKGARLLCGGQIDRKLGGLFFQATVLSEVTSEMKIYHEETFGPILPLIAFEEEKEVLRKANDSQYGLAAYVYSENISRAHRVADQLEYGMVGVNTAKFTGAPVPFGGVKQSGLGREGSHYGLDDYTETKYVCIGGLN